MNGIADLLILFFFLVLPFALWVWALVDILTNEFTGNNKILWLLVVILVPLIGLLAYFIVGRKQKLLKN